MMVVPVLMMSCQVSEYPKTGPVTPQIRMDAQAMAKAAGVPSTHEARRAASEKDQGVFGSSDISSLTAGSKLSSFRPAFLQEGFVDGKRRARSFGRRDDGKLHVAGDVPGNEDAGHAGPAVRVAGHPSLRVET